MQKIDGGPIHTGPPVQLMVDGELTFRAIVAAIDSAREEILLETYILRADRIGATVRNALVSAVHRRVRVYLLVDAIGSATTADDFWKSLTEDGVMVRHFHPLFGAPLQALRRDHRKILVVDRSVAFTGGMNIAEEYGSSIKAHKGAWRDSFIRVDGSVAQELAAVFAEGWDRAEGPPLPGLEYVSWSQGIITPPRGFASMTPRGLRARMERRLAMERDRRRGRRVARTHRVIDDSAERSVLVLDPRPGRAQRETLAVMAALVGGARKRLWITTPYFAPPTRALWLLGKTARDGVDVRLLVPGKTDVAIMRHAAHGAYSYLLSRGVRIFEYEAAILHSKTLVVDGYAGMIGSSNLDFRSFWLNAECNLLLFDEACGATLDQAFTDDVKQSREVTSREWSLRSIRHALLDAAARSLRWAL
jgi:cardiolipin synthase